MTSAANSSDDLRAQVLGPDGVVTLVEGASFCRSDRGGDILEHRSHGLFYRDTRILSAWELRLDDQPTEPLNVLSSAPFIATFVSRAAPRPGRGEPTIVVERRRMIADGMREDIVVRNYAAEAAGVVLTLRVAADFADLFTVKDRRPVAPGRIRRHSSGEDLELSVSFAGERRGIRVHAHSGQAQPGGVSWRITVAPHGEWRTTVEVLPSTGGREVPAAFPLDRPVPAAAPADRLRKWSRSTPDVECDDPTLARTLERSVIDLGGLRIVDPEHSGFEVIAAGAPWFMTLFGRDSLLTGWMTLAWDLELTRGTLHALARLQGTQHDLLSEEEPGRILHEVRRGIDPGHALGGSRVYYGSVDATPLFVMVLAKAARWGLPADDLRALVPAADRALGWIRDCGDLDGDGFVEYQRKTDRGLLNQGWKDSQDSITFADGRIARGPIALAEVQGYVYGAYRARAELADIAGEPNVAGEWRARAATLKQRFNEAFWLPERGYYALALDGDKRPVDALASNQGHCLWSGIVNDDMASDVVAALMSAAMFTGWGVRTLSADMAAFNPVSYHNGSVWPHDNALIVEGLARYGFADEARLLAASMITAAGRFGGRLPELFCGFDRSEILAPVPYPTSCSPQAWAAAAPLGMLTALLGIEPDVARPTVAGKCMLPPQWGRVRIHGLAVGDRHLDIDSDRLQPLERVQLPLR